MSFPTTHWTRAAAATLSGDSAGQEALASLCRDYRAPVLGFLRAKGYDFAHAEDLVQDCFLELIRSRAWKRVDRARGRFRNFLVGTLMHVISREREHAGSLKRGGGQVVASLDEIEDADRWRRRCRRRMPSRLTASWAINLMESALGAVQREFAQSGRANEWTVLVNYLPGAGAAPAYEEAADRLGMTPGA
jgi:RNA polymerase sigma-70 factor (ECF subfamily)